MGQLAEPRAERDRSPTEGSLLRCALLTEMLDVESRAIHPVSQRKLL